MASESPSISYSEQTSCFSKAGHYANSIWNAAKPNTVCKALAWVSVGTISAFGGGYFLLQAMQHQNVGANLALGVLLAVSGSAELSAGLILPKHYMEEAERNERTPLTPGVNP